MIKKCTIAIFLMLILVGGLVAQDTKLKEEKAFVSNAYGEFNEETVRSMFDTFFVTLTELEGSTGIVVISGPLNELISRKQLMVNHIRFRKFDPERIEYRFIGGTMNPQTDLWIVPAGAEPPKIDVKAYIAFEFGRANKKRVERYMQEFYNALLNDENSQGYIINYGTSKQIAERERLIANSIRFRRFDPSRITLVSGGSSGNGIKTVMWIVPEGAENPKP